MSELVRPRTICVECEHAHTTVNASRFPCTIDYVCLACPRQQAIDPVTGELAYMDETGLVRLGLGPHPECWMINNGECQLFEVKEVKP